MPADFGVADFCSFLGAYLPSVREMRVVRSEVAKNVCLVFLSFDSVKQAALFYKDYNGKAVESPLLYVEDRRAVWVGQEKRGEGGEWRVHEQAWQCKAMCAFLKGHPSFGYLTKDGCGSTCAGSIVIQTGRETRSGGTAGVCVCVCCSGGGAYNDRLVTHPPRNKQEPVTLAHNL